MMKGSGAPSDQDLVEATLKDRHAFALLVNRYEASLTRYITRLGSVDSETTKDILQESFIKAYIHLNDYDPSLSFSAWLYRIVHNETINYFRALRNRPRSVVREEDLALFEKIADDLNIEREASARFDQTHLRTALQSLEQKYRDVVILRFFEDKSYEEISDILQIPSGTVAIHLSRAKHRLKTLLKTFRITDV
jgi:RNA polymerase sigma-70 factor (ECF subfamily)